MSKILGIDAGTNSLGWAVVDKRDDGTYELMDHGVHIFQEGVKIEKGIESSKASERTMHRSIRRHYWRRKVRKINLLSILSKYGFCPKISSTELRSWREGKAYPSSPEFRDWQKTEDKLDINPYHYRYICLTQQLDLNKQSERYVLGRALYHINQRRGFLSNRKTNTEESDGKVITGISDLTKEMAESGCQYLGEYFYHLYKNGERIRSHYTARNEHYLKEFEAICMKQDLSLDMVDELRHAIFYQRPLKSQKQQVGKCMFEPKKARCPISHPLFEEFRMYSFLNNIKIQTPEDYELRPLSQDEKEQIIPLFYRKSKSTFKFEEIAKKLAIGKNSYCYFKERNEKPFRFNYYMDTVVSGCPIGAQLSSLFGDSWKDGISEVYTLAGQKTQDAIINDVWHVLFSFDNDEKLKEFAVTKLQLDESQAKEFSKIHIPQGYASLSHKAIVKILPYLRDYGLRYDEAVFLANLETVIPSNIWRLKSSREEIISSSIDVLRAYAGGVETGRTAEQRLKVFLRDRYSCAYPDNDYEEKILPKLYHPSMIESYTRQEAKDGIFQLGSPRLNSVKNPMAMHSLFQVRKVVNTLLREKKIDEKTVIHIELARELNDANKRKAIKDYQSENEKNRDTYRKKIQEHYQHVGINREPSDIDILKYQLWEEQKAVCLYTGEQIGLADFLGDNPLYDIEHTIPQSLGGDSTKMNLTLCNSKYNREIKKANIPSQMSNHEEILSRIDGWKKQYENLDFLIRRLKGSVATTKEQKDAIIVKRHKLVLERDYWKGKYERFTMTSVPEGFSRRQGADIGVISKYARLYLKSVFNNVYVVKGLITSDFRKIWGIQEEYVKKERDNHVHHCIDAIVIACIGPGEYGQLSHYYNDLQNHKWYGLQKPQFSKPWSSFAEDIKKLQDDLLVSHFTQDNMPKVGKRNVMTPKGKVLTQGDSARAGLHLDSYYGAIQVGDSIKYAIRKPVDTLQDKEIDNIVDDEVRRIVREAQIRNGNLKKAKENDDLWMNREKGIRINKVRVLASHVVRPLNIREQRDLSDKEYKRQYHVMNDRNYLMAIYQGVDVKGKTKKDFELFNMLDAAEFYKVSGNQRSMVSMAPKVNAKGYELQYTLKAGSMVLLYEQSPEELYQSTREELTKRLYKVTGLSSLSVGPYTYGTIVLSHHQDARKSSEKKTQKGIFVQQDQVVNQRMLLHTQINALVSGVDFQLNELGEIKFLKER